MTRLFLLFLILINTSTVVFSKGKKSIHLFIEGQIWEYKIKNKSRKEHPSLQIISKETSTETESDGIFHISITPPNCLLPDSKPKMPLLLAIKESALHDSVKGILGGSVKDTHYQSKHIESKKSPYNRKTATWGLPIKDIIIFLENNKKEKTFKSLRKIFKPKKETKSSTYTIIRPPPPKREMKFDDYKNSQDKEEKAKYDLQKMISYIDDLERLEKCLNAQRTTMSLHDLRKNAIDSSALRKKAQSSLNLF